MNIFSNLQSKAIKTNHSLIDLTCLNFSLAPMLFQIHTQQSLSNTIMLLLTLKPYGELSDLKFKLKDSNSKGSEGLEGLSCTIIKSFKM